MQSQSVSRIAMLAMVVCGLLVAESSARAGDHRTKSCTNGTLQGDYGYASEGVLIGVPGLPPEAPFRSVGVANFDGTGNLTWVEHTVVNGILLSPDWAEATGTYTVNSNCTGAAVVDTPSSFAPLNLAFVVVKQGKEVHSLLDTNAIATVFTKVE